ncbi:SURF1 family protein [Cellulomonas sp. APG4]|uniref:SURF1 family cytochrome oxidase biogenesis protein n=1 Tax=Cellulomonas sp. APG4 TaxID=1538656 RepID=UPI00137B15FF|nr:SURF1 family protein [Cellulomonas sp. APG4]
MGPRARRWVSTLAVAALVALGCVGAGLWQWSRHQERSAAIALVEENEAAPVVPLADVLTPDGALDADDVWRHVRVRGTYLPGSTVLLRNRPVNSVPAYHVLAGLTLTEGPLAGRVLVVDRGWVPSDDAAGVDDLPELPAAQVDLVVRLRASERLADRDAPPGQVQALAPAQVARAGGWPVEETLDLYTAVVQEDGGAPAGLRTLPGPTTDYGSHLSYAFQWWVFAVGAFVGAVLLLRRDEADAELAGLPAAERADVAARGPHVAPTAGRTPRRRRRRPTAEDEEDAILDAQESARGR